MERRLNWYQAVGHCEDKGEPYVLVTVLGVTGSVPREPATKMVVTGEHSYDTIGGGHLEYRICQQARERLAKQDYTSEIAHFPLGASLGQCCGGSVSVLNSMLSHHCCALWPFKSARSFGQYLIQNQDLCRRKN